MILAIDVYYYEKGAKSVGILFQNWADDEAKQIIHTFKDEVAPYEAGNFYKRELPCILQVLEEVNLSELDCIIVDGYVILDDEGKLGLGGHLYQHLNKAVPIIGVAKSSFHQNLKNVTAITRGESKKPLYITAKGITLEEATTYIQHMHGNYRMPTLLSLLDQETKKEQ